jgi:hypothetical protein
VSKKYLSTLYITIIFLPNGIRDNYLTTPIVAQSGVASDHVGKVYQNVLSKEEKRSMGYASRQARAEISRSAYALSVAGCSLCSWEAYRYKLSFAPCKM